MIDKDKHLLKEAAFIESPNHGRTFGENLPDTIVIHYTAGSSAESSIRTLRDPNSKASAHLVVARDGKITQLIPFNTIAWHAGKSRYRERIGFNKYSIGIEIDNAGRLGKSGNRYKAWFGKLYPPEEVVEAVHRNESASSFWHDYTEKQIEAVFDICAKLRDAYGVSTILGHEEISPKRKIDPGPAFPLDKLHDQVILRDRSEEGEEEDELPPQGMLGVVTASKLNVRSRPSVAADPVAAPLPKGTRLDIRRELNGWYEVGIQGWVKKDYVRT